MTEITSKMNAVAEIFGKSLGVVFEVKVSRPFNSSNPVVYKVSFEANGLFDVQNEQFNNKLLVDLLTGKAMLN